MKLKIIIKDPEYPRLMTHKHSGIVFLMTSNCSGTLISDPSNENKIGKTYRHLWTEQFVDFNGSITLSN